MVKFPDGRSVAAETIDMSSGGTGIRLAEALDVMPQSQVHLAFPVPSAATDLPATVVSSEGSVLRVRFENLTIAEQEVLTIALYSRADSWLGWGESRENDNVLRSLGRIFQISMHGMWVDLPQHVSASEDTSEAASRAPSPSPALDSALPGCGAGPGRSKRARPKVARACRRQRRGSRLGRQLLTPRHDAPVPPGQYRDTSRSPMPARRRSSCTASTPAQHLLHAAGDPRGRATAKIHIYYSFSPSLLPQLSHFKLIMNGTLFATIQPTPGQMGGSDSRDAEAEFTIPPELLVHNNTLTIEFIGHYTMVCEDPANTTLWARVHRNTYHRHPRRSAASGRRSQAVAHAVSRSRRDSAAQHSRRLSRRRPRSRPFRPPASSPATSA